jgi:hypothetical protein
MLHQRCFRAGLRLFTRLTWFICLLLPAACNRPAVPVSSGAAPEEHSFTPVPLAWPLSDAKAEVSGLAWYHDSLDNKDYLILLPQNRGMFATATGGLLFALPKEDLEGYLAGTRKDSLRPMPIRLEAPGLKERTKHFGGYEAIAFAGQQAFLTVEAGEGGEMRGYVVTGQMPQGLSSRAGGAVLQIDTSRMPVVYPRAPLNNMAEEALLVAGGRVVTFYEANGKWLNVKNAAAAPVAHTFSPDLTPGATVPMPPLEYRITDATEPDEQNRFWVLNYFFAGESKLFFPRRADLGSLLRQEPLVAKYGQGASHASARWVERLVELQYTAAGITLTQTPPVQLQLGAAPRNWEGVVRWGKNGFVLVTDMFPKPTTILGVVQVGER